VHPTVFRGDGDDDPAWHVFGQALTAVMADTVIGITVTASPPEPATTFVVVSVSTARAVRSVLVHELSVWLPTSLPMSCRFSSSWHHVSGTSGPCSSARRRSIALRDKDEA